MTTAVEKAIASVLATLTKEEREGNPTPLVNDTTIVLNKIELMLRRKEEAIDAKIDSICPKPTW
jgi:hypothetical protein